MLDKIPNSEEMTALVGQSLYDIWNKLCALIDEKYDMERLWNKGGKAWTYEYKYRRGGKTLCALYARENCIGFMIILGKDERLKFDTDRNSYSKEVQKILPFLSDTWPLCRIGRAVIRASQSCRQSCNKSQCPACGCRSHHSCTHAPQFSRSFPAREWGSVLQRQGACGQCP